MSDRSIEDLVGAAAEGDEEAQKEITERFQSVQQEKTQTALTLKLKTDERLKELYPRALRAYDKGRLDIGSAGSEDDVIAALKDKEDELAELGVPVSTTPPATEETPAATAENKGDDTADSETTEEDPAGALAGGAATSGPGGQPRDIVLEFFEDLKGTTRHDQERAFAKLVELNQRGDKAKIKEITARMQSEPIRRRIL